MLAFAGILIFIGTLVVLNRAGISPVGGTSGLDINGVIQNTNSASPIPVAPPPVRPTAVNVPLTKLTGNSSPASTPPPSPPSETFDWSSFITALTHPSTQTSNASGNGQNTGISDAYSFIPSGLVSPQEPKSTFTMSDSQKALYGWGQDAGSVIKGYEDSHPNQPAILTDYMQDRQSTSKIAAMKQLGADLQGVGDSIDGVGSAPPQMSTAGPALADAYREIGRNLAAIPDVQGDNATVQAILTYDKSAEAFAKKYVNVVLIFQANDVAYTQNEPGGVFMFPASQ